MKMRLFGSAITPVGNLARDSCRVSVSVFSQHNRKRINHAVNFRLMGSLHTPQPLAAESLESLLQEIEAITKCLVARQMWKPVFPIIPGELVNGFLLKQSVVMTEEENSNQLLVSKTRLGIIAQALKTSVGASIVCLTDTQI